MTRQHRQTGRTSSARETDSTMGGAYLSPTVVIKMTILKTHSVWQCTYTSQPALDTTRTRTSVSIRPSRVTSVLLLLLSVLFIIMAFEDRSSPSAANESIQTTTTPNSPESSRTSPYTCTTIQGSKSPGVVEEKPFFRITSFALNGRHQTDETRRTSPKLVIPYNQGFRIASPDDGLSSPRSPSDSVRSFDTSNCSTPPPTSSEKKCAGKNSAILILLQSQDKHVQHDKFEKNYIDT